MQDYAELIDALDAPSALIDTAGAIVCHNSAFAAHCLRENVSLVGIPLTDIWGSDDGALLRFLQDAAHARDIEPISNSALSAKAISLGSDRLIFCQATSPHFDDPLLHFFVEHVDQGFWDFDTRTRRFTVSDAWRDMRGIDHDADVNDPESDWLDDIHPDDRELITSLLDSQSAPPSPSFSIQFRRRHLKTGNWIWLLCHAKVIASDSAGRPLRIVGTDTDITELKEDETRLAQLKDKVQLAIEVSGIGIWEFDLATSRTFWDDRLLAIYGLPPGNNDLPADAFNDFLHPDDAEATLAYLAHCNATRSDIKRDFRIVRPSGEVRHIRSMARFTRVSPEETKLIGVNIDLTEDVKRAQELEHARQQLEYESRHDALTGLANRRLLDEKLNEILEEDRSEEMGVMHLDLDRFKEINDTFGHAAGDAVLVHVAHTLRRILDDVSLICRFGGDEFAVLFAQAPSSETLKSLADRIIEAFKVPFIFEGQALPIGVSIGSASGFDKETLFSHADIALYAAKNAGRSRYRTYSVRSHADTKGRVRRRQDLLDALTENRIECWYQPQFDARTHAMTGAEALARMRLPNGTVLAPEDFLPLAEQTGHLNDIEELVFQQVLVDQSRWFAAGLDYPTIAVNLSQNRLSDEALVESVAQALNPHHAIAVELLETALLDVPDTAERQAIEGLRALGLSIELDDFGSGHASIVAAIALRPDRIKVDQRLTEDIASCPKALATLQAVVAVGRAQDTTILLEGIETPAQLEAVKNVDCDFLQGYALMPPQTAEDFAKSLRQFPRTQSRGT